MSITIFGEPWDAPICEEAKRVATPVGENCAWCKELVEDGDRGVIIACLMSEGVWDSLPWHAECFLRSTVGSPAHLAGRCSCHGGSNETELSARDEAREVWRQRMERA